MSLGTFCGNFPGKRNDPEAIEFWHDFVYIHIYREREREK